MRRFVLALVMAAAGWLQPLAAQQFSVLHAFGGNADGKYPYGNLCLGNDGRLYGMTNLGGANQDGVIFALNADGTGFAILHTFSAGIVVSIAGGYANGGPINPNDGGQPDAGLIQGTDGRLYGTTPIGGVYGEGALFAIKTDGTGFTVLRGFASALDGSGPQGGLLQGSDGRIYGATSTGGPLGAGTLYAVKTDGTGFTVLYNFTGGADGGDPQGGLIQGRDGRIYGTAADKVFALNPDGTGFTVLHATYLGGLNGGLLQGGDGRLYGSFYGGGTGWLYAVAADGTGFTILYRFIGGPDGGGPLGSLIQGNDGRLYGTTTHGGASGANKFNGTLFAVNTDGSGLTTIYSFSGGADGSIPNAGLVEGANHLLYGVAQSGGSGTSGTLFSYGFAAPTVAVATGSQTATAGQSVTMAATASGFPGYQWTFDGVPIPGATGESLTLPNVALSAAGTYAVVATNLAGTATSGTVTLAVNAAAAFSVNPLSVTLESGRSAALSALAFGQPAPSYQWSFNGVPLAGATDHILLVTASSASAGTYTCTATNSAASVTSAAAVLTVVTTSNPGHLSNLSGRAMAGDAGNSLIAGYVVGGSGSKSLLLRGVGPGLASTFAVGGALGGTQLALMDANQLTIATNGGWGNNPIRGPSPVSVAPTPASASLMSSVGAFPLVSPSFDSAMAIASPTGAFSAQVTAMGGAAGIALAEVYDADSGVPAARLVNLSVRANAGLGGNMLIGGFSIAGATADTLLIRAIGPGLTDTFGLTGTLAQPVLSLFDSGQNLIDADTGWGGDATIASVAASVGAFSLNPAHQDSALLVSLPPGSYTAQVSGANNATGIALVEVYEVP